MSRLADYWTIIGLDRVNWNLMILIPFSKSSNSLIKVHSLFPGRDEVAVYHEAAMVIQTIGSSCLAPAVRAATVKDSERSKYFC